MVRFWVRFVPAAQVISGLPLKRWGLVLMPNNGRKMSESGFYHVIVKGDGGRILFEGEDDRRRFLDLLEASMSEEKVNIHAYCLMENHVHLLVEDPDRRLSAFMKMLDERYAMYFAKRTGRVGHVFQGRYWSEPVEGDAYFLSALRYIHLNPVVGRICRARDYRWSSYSAYLGGSSFATTDLALSLLGGHRQFEAFMASGPSPALPFPGSKLRSHLGPDELFRVAEDILGPGSVATISGLDKKSRNEKISILLHAGLSEREVARLTGVGRSIIHRVAIRDAVE